MGLWNPFEIARRLNRLGLVGIGRRNAEFVLMYNPRKFYPRVDDKLITKKLALAAGLPVPELYAVVREEHEIGELHEKLKDRESFVVKPAHGSGGDGIAALERINNRSAVLMSFEQLGGADRALEMARDYALERYAFGRPIGSLSGQSQTSDSFIYERWSLACGYV